MKTLNALLIATLFVWGAQYSFAGSPGTCDECAPANHAHGYPAHNHDTTHTHPAPKAPEWEPSGWYLGISAGLSQSDVLTATPYAKPSTYPERPSYTTAEVNEREVAYRAYFGRSNIVSFLQDDRLRFGLEYGYANLGEFDDAVSVTALDTTLTGRFDIGKGFGLLGRAGAARWDTDGSGSTDFASGLGLTHDTLDHLRMRLEWLYYADANDGEDVNAVMLAATYRF